MFLSDADWQALWLTCRLASLVTLLLLLIGTPIAWILARSQAWWKPFVSIVVSFPLVLPPTVLGFYLLLVMGKNGPLGKLSDFFGYGTFAFSFSGLVIASLIYSLPFMVQPLQNSFEALGQHPLEVASTLRASPLDAFFSVVVPLSMTGFRNGALMTFLHTIGEFGVVLMIGGNRPNETRLVSIQLYDYVEALMYDKAHKLAIVLVGLTFVGLLIIHVWGYVANRRAIS